jgi:probable O-glycosylation ligase (exosortase A-associated)
MRDTLLLVVVFAALPVILVKPHIGALFWAWISYFNPHRLTWTLDFFPFAAYIAATTVVGWLLAGWLFSREPRLPPWTTLTALLIVWAVWISFTTLFAILPDAAYPAWDQAVKILFMTLLTVTLMRSRKRIDALIWVIVLSISFYGVKGGIFTLLTGAQHRIWGPEGTYLYDNNSLAIALLMIIPLIRYLQLRTDNWWLRIGLLGLIAACLISVLASYSRGAFLTLGATLCFLIFKTRRRVFFTLILVATLVFSFAFFPEPWYDRMRSIQTYQEDDSALSRIKAWKFAIETANQHPALGGGFGIFQLNTYEDRPGYHNAHSIYFEVLGGHGYVGLLLFLAIGVLSFSSTRQIVKRTRDEPTQYWARDLAQMLQISLVAYAVGGAFLNIAFHDLPYHIVALVILTQVEVSKAVAHKLDANRLEGTAIGRNLPAQRAEGSPDGTHT